MNRAPRNVGAKFELQRDEGSSYLHSADPRLRNLLINSRVVVKNFFHSFAIRASLVLVRSKFSELVAKRFCFFTCYDFLNRIFSWFKSYGSFSHKSFFYLLKVFGHRKWIFCCCCCTITGHHSEKQN